MSAALQNANGPDEGATSVRAGSNPLEMGNMNRTEDNTGAAPLPALSRRGFLGGVAVAAVPSTVVAASTSQIGKSLSPEERIAAAVQEIEAAMAERFPGFKISAKVEDKRPQIFGKGEGEIHRSMVMIYAHEDRYGPEEARWFVDYPDVRGAYR